MGSAQSARGTQLGGRGRLASRADGLRATVPGDQPGPRRAHFLRGGAPRPAPCRQGSARAQVADRPRGRPVLQGPRSRFVRLGAADAVLLCPPPLSSGGRGPSPPAWLSTGRGLSSVRADRVASSGGVRPSSPGTRGQRR